jgi:hypothetical protein
MSFAPTSINTTVLARKPVVSTLNDGGTSVEGCDLIGSYGTTSGQPQAFQVAAFLYLNPGLAQTFPWLAPIAQQYQEYRFRVLEFIWVSSASTTSIGDLILSPNYNSMQSIPTNEAQAMNMSEATEGSLWSQLGTSLNSKDMSRSSNDSGRKYIRSFAIAGDLKTYDAGALTVAFAGAANSTTLYGRLFVRYCVDLYARSTLTSYNLRAVTTTVLTVQGDKGLSGTYSAIQYDTVVTDGMNLAALNGFGQFPSGSTNITLPVGAFKVTVSAYYQIALGGTAPSSGIVQNLLTNVYNPNANITYVFDNQDYVVPPLTPQFNDYISTTFVAYVVISPAQLQNNQNSIVVQTCSTTSLGSLPSGTAINLKGGGSAYAIFAIEAI